MKNRRESGSAVGAGEVGNKWADPQSGRDYAERRFATSRAATRDPRAIERILERMAPGASRASLLDVPCGAGRLAFRLRTRVATYVGVDISRSMLATARGSGPGLPLCQASASSLPFPDRCFDIVICNRLLHHLDLSQIRTVAKELVRVSSGLVVASFWDAASIPAWRRRTGLRRGKRDSRIPVSRGDLVFAFEEAGARVEGWRSGIRFVTMQSYVVVRTS